MRLAVLPWLPLALSCFHLLCADAAKCITVAVGEDVDSPAPRHYGVFSRFGGMVVHTGPGHRR